VDWKRKMLAIISVILISFSGSFYLSEAHISKDLPLPHLRQPAEFEPMEGVLIRYPFGISYEIIGEMAEDTKVTTIVANNQERNYVLNQYSVHGINISNCDFLIADTDTYWTRDYGPWFVFTGDGNLSVVDFTYNRPRPHDNQIPYNFAPINSYFFFTTELGILLMKFFCIFLSHILAPRDWKKFLTIIIALALTFLMTISINSSNLVLS